MSDVRLADTQGAVSSRSPRSRAGNAMGRSRAAALDGARRVLAEHGIRKASMSDVAVRGGLAKATLYNHFRTKSELIAGLIADDVVQLADDCVDLAHSDLAVALTRAADAICAHPVIAGLRRVEPTALLAVTAPGTGPVWDGIRTQVARTLDAADASTSAESVDLVCRWLASHVIAPGSSDLRAQQARLVAAALPAAIRTTTFATPVAP